MYNAEKELSIEGIALHERSEREQYRTYIFGGGGVGAGAGAAGCRCLYKVNSITHPTQLCAQLCAQLCMQLLNDITYMMMMMMTTMMMMLKVGLGFVLYPIVARRKDGLEALSSLAPEDPMMTLHPITIPWKVLGMRNLTIVTRTE